MNSGMFQRKFYLSTPPTQSQIELWAIEVNRLRSKGFDIDESGYTAAKTVFSDLFPKPGERIPLMDDVEQEISFLLSLVKKT